MKKSDIGFLKTKTKCPSGPVSCMEGIKLPAAAATTTTTTSSSSSTTTSSDYKSNHDNNAAALNWA